MNERNVKLRSLAEAAALIKDGARIHLGGMAVHNHPMAFVYELLRQGTKDLTIVSHVSASDVDILIGASRVKRLEFSYVGLEEFGTAPCFRRAAEGGTIELAEYSEPVAFERFACSARGMPFFTTREMVGTDLPKVNPDIKEIEDPFGSGTYHAVSAAEPEWVIIHAPMADKYGNVVFFPHRQLPEDLDLIASRTTRNLIVTVEQIVTHERVRQLPYLNLIPRFRPTAVVEVPYGAHPFSCLHVYDQDREHLSQYARAGRTPDSFQEYLDTYVYGVARHADYLNLIGAARLAVLRQIGGGL
ncbi:MAG: CoA transferase subunit A [Dehalococcoidia bacterium]|nr:CoA transferase subunit A [Dehalococcoidia bacterium]